MDNTIAQFEEVIKICRDVFESKMKDYGVTWRIMRPQSLTDQLLVKANRIRTLETKKKSNIDEGIFLELNAIINYALFGLIKLHFKEN